MGGSLSTLAPPVAIMHSAQVLLDAGAGVDAYDRGYNTALIKATQLEHHEVIQALLDAGAFAGHTNLRHQTALFFAVEHDDAESVVTLLRYRASITEGFQQDGSAIYHCARWGNASLLGRCSKWIEFLST